MTSSKIVSSQARIDAPVSVLRDLVADAEGWVQLHQTAAHAEYLERGEHEDVVRQWSVADERTARTRVVRRRFAPDGGEISFTVEEPAGGPVTGGGWTFDDSGRGGTTVTMHHDLGLGTEAGNGEAVQRVRQGGEAYLATLKDAAERREELAELTVSFEDPVFVSGSVKDVYEYLYEADKWPQRIPHVTRLELEEPEPDIQFFDMDTVSADGSRHTTRSVRICLPPHLIVYKQIRTPPLLTVHTGHWKFAETPEGVLASARHTATIDPGRLHVLGEGTTVRDARRYLRRVLSANSVGNLRLAKEFAEQRAGV
ncbi:SRPBCC family protein [Amycolatopsis sp. VC5-11]|uniref:SRPBCC family protein n=1 Tax=Amycolatopsis sp. VC5-11 TaxID=3120156 RepID=UPI0030093A0D